MVGPRQRTVSIIHKNGSPNLHFLILLTKGKIIRKDKTYYKNNLGLKFFFRHLMLMHPVHKNEMPNTPMQKDK
jgi:hypothetical protein